MCWIYGFFWQHIFYSELLFNFLMIFFFWKFCKKLLVEKTVWCLVTFLSTSPLNCSVDYGEMLHETDLIFFHFFNLELIENYGNYSMFTFQFGNFHFFGWLFKNCVWWKIDIDYTSENAVLFKVHMHLLWCFPTFWACWISSFFVNLCYELCLHLAFCNWKSIKALLFKYIHIEDVQLILWRNLTNSFLHFEHIEHSYFWQFMLWTVLTLCNL